MIFVPLLLIVRSMTGQLSKFCAIDYYPAISYDYAKDVVRRNSYWQENTVKNVADFAQGAVARQQLLKRVQPPSYGSTS